MRRQLYNLRDDARGATMVEFALCAMVFFAMLGGVFDLGMMIRSYNSLEDAVRYTARGAAIRASTTGVCADARSYVVTVGDQKLRTKYGIKDADWTGAWDYPAAGVSLKPTLTLSARIGAKCFFICQIVPNGVPISVSAEVDVDNRNIRNLDDDTFVCSDFSV